MDREIQVPISKDLGRLQRIWEATFHYRAEMHGAVPSVLRVVPLSDAFFVEFGP
jgi:hypothetical protein